MTAPQEPLKLTLEEGLMLLAERRNGRRVTYEVDTPDGVPCWVAWEHYVTLGPADSWEDALAIALECPVVARADAAELRAALRRCSNLIQDFLDFGIAPVDRGPARHAVEAARAALAATEGRGEP